MRMLSGVVLGLLLLGGCAGNRQVSKPDAFLAEYKISRPTPTAITYCSHHGCLKRDELSLSEVEWSKVRQAVSIAAKTPAEERKNISKSVAAYEKIAGAAFGTSADKGRTGLNNSKQLDCIDESLNTTTLLLLLQDEKLIKWHSINGTVGRGGAFDWPHFSASLRENGSREIYVIDSWFRNNGVAADVLPLAKWKEGWNPS